MHLSGSEARLDTTLELLANTVESFVESGG